MNNKINERISLLLKSEKNKKNSKYNQKALASAINVPEGTLSGWLLKGRVVPAVHISAICEFFGASINWLLTGEGEIGDEQETHEQKTIIFEYSEGNRKIKITIPIGTPENERRSVIKEAIGAITEKISSEYTQPQPPKYASSGDTA